MSGDADDSEDMDLSDPFKPSKKHALTADDDEEEDDAPRKRYKRAVKKERKVSAPVQDCQVDNLIKDRPDKAKLQAHMAAVAAHRQKYQDRVDAMQAEVAGGNVTNQDAIPPNKAKVTEAIGEREATIHMIQKEPEYRLLSGFSPGTGFDQVWVKGDPIDTYMIVEAKGPGAQLATGSKKGDQMSAEWVGNSLKEIVNSPTTTADEKAHARAMQKAMATGKPPKVLGKVIEAKDGGGAVEKPCPDGGSYN